jgi:tRNA(Ile)-lysidine synthase
MEPRAFRKAVEADIRRHDLIPPGGEVSTLVSGGADSTCLWHTLRELGYDVSALHVAHGLRGAESEDDAAFCRDVLGAEVVDGRGGRGIAYDAAVEGAAASPARPMPAEDELREIRYSFATDRLRATGHTASDQVETVLYRIIASGAPGRIDRKRADGVVRPLLDRWRDDTEAYCLAEGLDFRQDTSNPDSKRGLIRDQILPLLLQLHPAAEGNLLRLADRKTAPPELVRLLESVEGSTRLDLGGGRVVVREYDQVWLERSPVVLDGEVRWGSWRILSDLKGLKVRGWRPGDRLAGRTKKIQDVFVDAKVPRSEREAWPLVVRGDEVVAVPGIIEADGVVTERMPSASSGAAGGAGPEGTV